MKTEITHQAVAKATARFLEDGGLITNLPDTVEDQRAWLRLQEKLSGLVEFDEQPGF